MNGPTLYGYYGDVNNTIPFASAYPGGRATSYVPPTASNYAFRNNSAGELSALNQDRFFRQMSPPAVAGGMGGGVPVAAARETAPSSNGSVTGKPATWWIMFAVVFMLFIWISRKYDTGQNFGNIKLSLWNGLFLTFFIVLMLNLLKVFAAKVKIPGVSELILAA